MPCPGDSPDDRRFARVGTAARSAEGDLAANGAAKVLLEETPPTDGELQDAIGKISNFFATEGSFTQLTDVLHSTAAGKRVGSRLNGDPTAQAPSSSSSFIPGGSFKISAVTGSAPFGPPAHFNSGPPPSPGHRGDTVPMAVSKAGVTDAGGALGGNIMGLRPTPGGHRAPDGNESQLEDSAPSAAAEDRPQVPGPPLPQALSRLPADLGLQSTSEAEVPYESSGQAHAEKEVADATQSGVQAPRGLGFPAAMDRDADASQTLGAADISATTGTATSPCKLTGMPGLAGKTAQAATLGGSPAPSQGDAALKLLWKMRLGITPSGSADDTSQMRYLHIHERGRDQFQKFSKALIDQLSVECAESNPYVKALCAHRQEMNDSALDLRKEVCDSLAARLGTERADFGLATMTVSQEKEQYMPCEYECGDNCQAAGSHRFDGEQLYLPELEARHQRHMRGHRGHLAHMLPEPSETVSTDRSTTAGSARSDPEARRVVIAGQGENSSSLKLRIGRKRLELSEDDRSGFLEALGDTCEHSTVALGRGPIRGCGGDVAPTPRFDLD